MIETHDQHKPGNLANSAVLKMLEEEESERIYPVNERKSRPRQRQQILIDRDTVLKINRRRPYHHRHRDFSWPPPPTPDDRSRSRCNSEEIHFDDSICRRHEIFHLKEMFDKGAIDDNKENISRTFIQQNICCVQKQSHDDNIINSQNVKYNTKEKMKFYDHTEYNNSCNIQQSHHMWPPKYTSNNIEEPIIVNRAYYLPENELHNLGIIEPKLRYFERAASNSPDRHRYHACDDLKLSSSLKRWKSNESVEKTTKQMNISSRQSKYEKSYKNDNNNNDSFLERYKSNSFNELPPLKPRREYHKNMHSTKTKLNLNNLTTKQAVIDKAMSQQDNSENEKNCFDENSQKDSNMYVTMCKDCLLNLKKVSSLKIPSYSELANNELSLTNQRIDNCEIKNKNKLNTPAMKNFNDKTNLIYEENDTNFICTKNNANQIANNCNNYRCCCHCGKITHEYEIVPQSTLTVVNYDLAADTKYDAKNICSHNLSVKINENVNNISKNNICGYVDLHHHHHQSFNVQNNNKNDVSTMIEKQNVNDDNMKNILESRRMIESSPEIKQNECKQKKNAIMGIKVTSVANIQSVTATTVESLTTDTKTPATTTTTAIPSVIIMTGYRDDVETNLKGKSTEVSINICEKDALTYQSAMVADTTIIKENDDDDGNQGNQKPKRDKNLQATFGKQENITSNITRRQGEISKDRKQNEKIYGQEIIGLSKEDKKKWRRGIYFTDGEYLWGPYEKWPFEGEPPDILKKRIEEAFSENENDERPMVTRKNDNNQEKLSKSTLSCLNNNPTYESDLDMKMNELLPHTQAETNTDESQTQEQIEDYEIVHSSLPSELKNLVSEVDKDSSIKDLEAHTEQTRETITQNLRRIDEYMETAEQALNDAERQFSKSCTANNILVFDTPLPAVISDIFKRRLSPILSEKIPPIPPIRQTISYRSSPKVSIVENAPVVEQVLLDLYNISMAFDTINNLANISTAAGISGYTIPYLEDNNSTTSKTEARIIELPVVCADDNADDNIGRDEASLSTTTSPYSVCEESMEITSGTECHSSSSPIAIKNEEGISTTMETSTHIDEIIKSKNILSGFLITKQNQEEAFVKAGITLFEHPSAVIDFNDEDKSATSQCTTTFGKGNSTVIVDLSNGKTFQFSKEMTTSNDPLNIDKRAEETKIYDIATTNFNDNKFSQNDIISTSHTHDNGRNDDNDTRSGNKRCGDDDDDGGGNNNDDFNKQIHEIVHEVAKSKTDSQLHFAYDGQITKYAKLTSSHSCYDDDNDNDKSKFCDDTMNKDDKLIVKQNDDDYVGGHPSTYLVSNSSEKYQADNNNNNNNNANIKVKDSLMLDISKDIKLTYDHSKGKQTEKTVTFNDEPNQSSQSDNNQCHRRSMQRNATNKFRSISQPPIRTVSQQLNDDTERLRDNYYIQYDDDDDSNHNRHRPPLIRQCSLDSSESRYYASPSLYMCGTFEPAEGYRKVAWPPASEITPVKALTPQPQQPPHQGGHYYQPQQQTHPNYSQQQGVNLSQSQRQYHQQQQQQQQSYHQQQSVPSGTYHHQDSQAHPQQGSYPQQTQYRPQQSSQTYPQQGSYPQQTQYHQQASQAYPHSEQTPNPQQYYQQQHQRAYSNPPPSSTVSFCGGIPVRERQSPAPPSRRQYTPVPHQPPQQQATQPFSPSSQGPHSPMSPQPKGWSHVGGPTSSHPIGYTQGPQYHQSAAPEYPYGSGHNSQFGAGQQNQYYHQPSQQPQSNQQPYHSSVVSHHPPGQQQQPQQQYYQPQSQQQYNQPEPQYYHPQARQQQQQYQPSADRGQSPGVIQLRRETPISQRPAPVVQSQPAAARFSGGANMRGDLKWPPPEVKAQMAAEEEERIKLARSPAFRPRKVHKDYSQFFARHALNSTYPGYKVPPGTQHVYAQY